MMHLTHLSFHPSFVIFLNNGGGGKQEPPSLPLPLTLHSPPSANSSRIRAATFSIFPVVAAVMGPQREAAATPFKNFFLLGVSSLSASLRESVRDCGLQMRKPLATGGAQME